MHINAEKNMQSTDKNLENKVWYRFLKVVFILAIIGVGISSFQITADSNFWPQTHVDDSKIRCSNGSIVDTDEYNSSAFDPLANPFESNIEKVRSGKKISTDDWINERCNGSEYTNYVEKTVTGGAYQAIGYGVSLFVIGLILLFALKWVFFYIFYGKSIK